MRLYWSDVLSPRKACAVAKYLESPVEFLYLDLKKGEHRRPEYLALNPNGRVPTLTDGDRRLWEADAIMCYLADHAGSDLWPQERVAQIEIVRWFSWNLQHFSRTAGTLYFEHIIKTRFGLGDPDPQTVKEAQQQFREFAAILDDHLRERRWLLGDALSVADFAVAVTLPDAGRAHIPLDEFSSVRRWHDRLNELEAWREPFPPRVEEKAANVADEGMRR